MTDFVDSVTATIARWHDIDPPNDTALRLLAELEATIREFDALRGTLRFEDEPTSFEAALLEASRAGLQP